MTDHKESAIEAFCTDLASLLQKHGATIALSADHEKIDVTITPEGIGEQFTFDLENACWGTRYVGINMRVHWLKGGTTNERYS